MARLVKGWREDNNKKDNSHEQNLETRFAIMSALFPTQFISTFIPEGEVGAQRIIEIEDLVRDSARSGLFPDMRSQFYVRHL